MASETTIPGMKARHMIVRDGCRDLHGDDGAVAAAIEAIEEEARRIIGNWPNGKNVEFHFVLTVDRGDC